MEELKQTSNKLRLALKLLTVKRKTTVYGIIELISITNKAIENEKISITEYTAFRKKCKEIENILSYEENPKSLQLVKQSRLHFMKSFNIELKQN